MAMSQSFYIYQKLADTQTQGHKKEAEKKTSRCYAGAPCSAV